MWIKLISPRVTMRPMDSAFKRQMAPPLALLVLGALTPRHHRVTVLDENVQRLRLTDRPELVGISVKADTAQRAWKIARFYRRQNVPVVLGGIHPTACPHECARHADAIVVGEAEELWPRILRDTAAGCMQRVYQNDRPTDLARSPVPRWDLIDPRQYLYTNTLTIGRGCPWRCAFCYNSSPNLPAGYRFKSVQQILAELASLGSRHVMFIDDNFIANPGFARTLLPALRSLSLTWHTAVSADIGRHPDLLDVMAETGCRSLFIGFETLNPANLRSACKRQNRVDEYERIIDAIHQRGMMVNASVVFGFDEDGPDVFDRTTQWLIDRRVETMTAHILTPYPGTALHARWLADGRIIDHDLTHYNTSRAVFRPAKMTTADLETGYLRAYRRFYSWASILKRIPNDPRRRAAYLLFNICYRKYGRIASALGTLGWMRAIGRLAAKVAYPPLRTDSLGVETPNPELAES